ncbi:MAG: hypothetical protein E4H31_01855 [Dehalococcoidia bacterium]|nr:MAG: hypothetical protein E4H31_01855 [Dehalococcoidia bacterium]
MELARQFNGKKFMWDGKVYDSESCCQEQAQSYLAESFEVQTFDEDDKYYIFTRRVVAEVSV